MDTQRIEILGRNRLIGEIIAADLEVAIPLRHRGVDLVAYADLGAQTCAFAGCPIQMKAASARYFGVHRKYEKLANIVFAYVWNLADVESSVTYALTFPEARDVAETMGWTKTASWAKDGYSTSSPSARLQTLLAPDQTTSPKWRVKVLTQQAKAIA